MPDLDAQLAALVKMSPVQLKAEWLRVYKAPPPALTTDLLARGIAWRLQERVFGGLPSATVRELRRLSNELQRAGRGQVTTGRIKPGTRLVRDWGGIAHHVIVLDEGFLYQDRRYGSLSQIAREITGAHWSGPRFFGLKSRGKADA